MGAVVVLRTSSGLEIEVGPTAELESLFLIFEAVIANGEGYPQDPPLTWEQFEEIWVRPVTTVVGARVAGELVGAYYLKPNLPGKGSHIANAGYIVAEPSRHQGIGRCLVEDSIWRARLLGFDAIQFNFVFASNPARRMYESLGWVLVGTIPRAVDGEQDALIYWRSLVLNDHGDVAPRD